MAFDTKHPRFFVGKKLDPPKPTTLVPGAGAYDPSPQKVMKEMPSFSIKKRLGSSLATVSKVPGPGNYEVHLKNKKDAPKFGFGSSTRDQGKKKSESPGPGAYKVNSAIGDVPAYAMPGRSDEFKYI